MAGRVTQVVNEPVVQSTSLLGRVTQVVNEPVVQSTSLLGRVTQVVNEPVVQSTSLLARVTQVVLEVVTYNPVDIFPVTPAPFVAAVIPQAVGGAIQALEYASYFGPHRHQVSLGDRRGIRFARRE